MPTWLPKRFDRSGPTLPRERIALPFVAIAARPPAAGSVLFEERQQGRLDVRESRLQPLALVDNTDRRLHCSGLTERGKKVIRGHLNEDLGSFHRSNVILLEDPLAGVEREHGVPDPGLATFLILAQSELDFIHNLVREAVFDGFVRGHVEVAVGILLDLFQWLTR